MPLMSESATITDITAMDRDRANEIRRRLISLSDDGRLPSLPGGDRRIDWEALFDAAAESGPETVSQVGALHERFERRHPALVRIRFETDSPLEFVAGQYVTIRYRDRSRPYSLASSPGTNQLELCVRRVPDGKLSSMLCDQLATGDRLTVRGPNGHLHLENPSNRDVAFFGTGTGVAPLKSMIDHFFESGHDEYRGQHRDVWLCLGAAWADDLPYHRSFKRRDQQHDHFHYVPCVSREPWLSNWDGETEYIQDALLKYVDEGSLESAAFGRHIARFLRQRPAGDISARINPHELEAYACGLNGMVFGLETALRRLGVPERHIHGEGYG